MLPVCIKPIKKEQLLLFAGQENKMKFGIVENRPLPLVGISNYLFCFDTLNFHWHEKERGWFNLTGTNRDYML